MSNSGRCNEAPAMELVNTLLNDPNLRMKTNTVKHYLPRDVLISFVAGEHEKPFLY